jgi:hypothetical protein
MTERTVPRGRLGILTFLIWMGAAAGAQRPSPPALSPLDATGRISYFIAEGIDRSGHQPGDTELAEWALAEWARATGGALRFQADAESLSQIRIYWLPWAVAGPGQLELGSMQSFRANGRLAALISIRPNAETMIEGMVRHMQQDSLLRDTIIYLTCLHEIGHALGLNDSDNRADIMWGGGKNKLSQYQRYRQRLQTRRSISRVSWLSKDDIARLKVLYPGG